MPTRPRLSVFLMMHKGMLYKTVNFTNPVYVGDPINTVKIFSDFRADELFLVDIDCSKNKNEPDYEMLNSIAKYAQMPLCYGGGINTISQIKTILSMGYEKVLISSAVINNFQLIKDAINKFGGQSIAVCIDVKFDSESKIYKAYTINGTIESPITLEEILNKVLLSGAGEIIINSIDRDGTRLGYDSNLMNFVAPKINIPLVFLGGAGKINHLSELLCNKMVNAAAAGTIWTFIGKNKSVLINYLPPKKRLENKIFNPC
jgi:cyclase